MFRCDRILPQAKGRTRLASTAGMMSRLMITCPTTGQEVFTGVEIPSDTIAQIPSIVARMMCPVCKQEHLWSKEDAHVDDSGAGGTRPDDG